MRGAITSALVGGLLVAGGCEMAPSAAGGQGGQPGDAGSAVAPHEDARFLVRRGDEVYRANVRYVAALAHSVIAVRRGPGGADADWPSLEVSAAGNPPASGHFGAEAWRPVAVAVGEAVRRQAGLCPEGKEMRLVRRRDGSARTMYRQARQAWIVFAACRTPRPG